MDHRQGKRFKVKIEAMFYLDGKCVGSGTLENASLGGAFISTAYQPPHQKRILGLGLICRSRGWKNVLRFEAFIIHQGPRGLGMMVEGLDPHEIPELRQQIVAMRAPSSRRAAHLLLR